VDEARLPLVEHLAELRRRISWILVAWLAGAVVSWQFHTEIFGTLLRPAIAALAPDGGTLQAIAPTEIFFTYLKCALLAGFVGTLPVFFWQIWAFVSPGLYASEKKLVLPFVIASTLLFLAGASFGYFVVFPVMFEFFTGFEAEYVRSAWTMREVFGFTTRMILAFDTRPEHQAEIVSAIHVDGTCRPQTVSRDTNPRYWQLIKRFEEKTGIPVVLNTSFNVDSQPIVNTPLEAVDTFLNCGIDVLAIGNFLVWKTEQ